MQNPVKVGEIARCARRQEGLHLQVHAQLGTMHTRHIPLFDTVPHNHSRPEQRNILSSDIALVLRPAMVRFVAGPGSCEKGCTLRGAQASTEAMASLLEAPL